MQKKCILAGVILLISLAVIFTAGCVGDDTSSDKATVELVEIAAGQQVNALGLGQIDGLINWQPNIAAATVSGLGKVVSYSQDLPRTGDKNWHDHTCCVFGANEAGLKNKDMATVLTGLMIVGNQYVTDNPEASAVYAADWLYGSTNPTFGSKSVDPVEILKASLPTIKFLNEVTDTWLASNAEFVQIERDLGIITNNLKSTSDEETKALIYDLAPYNAAKKIISEKGTFKEPVSDTISVGHLISDHGSALIVLLKDWEYFKDNYNTYLKPVAEKSGPVDNAELYVNGKKICNVNIVTGTGGPNLMTMLQTNSIQYAIAGTPPYLTSIDAQAGLKILCPIMTEGSAFVVASSAPVNNWNEFVEWAKSRSAEGKNLIIAVPQVHSIQDVLLKAALESSDIRYVIKSV